MNMSLCRHHPGHQALERTVTMSQRSELKRAWRERTITAGIFAIRHCESGKLMLGSSLNLEGIWNRQKFSLELGGHENRALQADWKSQGAEAFEYVVLESIAPEAGQDPEAALKVFEALWLEQHPPAAPGSYHLKPRIRLA